MATTFIGKASIKSHLTRKDGNKEVAQHQHEIVTKNIVVDSEYDWQIRQLVAWLILELGWEIFD